MTVAVRRLRPRWASLIGVLLAACSAPNDPVPANPAQTTLERAQAEGKVRVGFAREAPYAYRDPATGRVTGEAPEVARHLLAGLGITQVESILTEPETLIPGLQAGRFDLIAGLSIRPQHCAEVRFSNPTYQVGEAMVVRGGNPGKLHSFEDVAARRRSTLGVVAGSVELDHARAAGIPAERILFFPGLPSAVAGVATGRVDGAAGSRLTLRKLVAQAKAGTVELARPFQEPRKAGNPVRSYGAFAFRKRDAAFVAAINARLADFIGSPEHAALVAPFGFTPADLPGKVSTDALCPG